MSMPIPETLSWPLAAIDETGRWVYSSGHRSVREVMLNILLTRPGERIMRPEFGAGILDFIHEPNNETTRHLLAHVVRKSLELWEPRVAIEAVEVVPDRTNLSEVHLTVRYHLRHNAAPAEFTLALELGLAG